MFVGWFEKTLILVGSIWLQKMLRLVSKYAEVGLELKEMKEGKKNCIRLKLLITFDQIRKDNLIQVEIGWL